MAPGKTVKAKTGGKGGKEIDPAPDGHSSSQSPPGVSGSKSSSACSSKGSGRVSLACVQCRSKHMRCDATQPTCGRCLLEKKPCYYAKSRRGIRDPLKRSLMSAYLPVPPPQRISPGADGSPLVLPLNDRKDLSNGWTRPHTPVNTAPPPAYLLDAFFEHFYHGQPLVPPKAHFLNYVALDPTAYSFLLSVIDFCGALCVKDARLHSLREVAYSTACGTLPFTVQSVQALHILSVLAFGETRFTHCLGFANRTWTMAIELGMHRKSFADGAPDPVLAESYRRTWWHVKFQNLTEHVMNGDSTAKCKSIQEEADVDIPCSEEWEYESGDIATPISLSQYEREATLGRSDPSSSALQIELYCIQANIAASCRDVDDESDVAEEMLSRADSTICDFIRRIPHWKLEVVDPVGRADQVLFSTVAWAHISRIRLRHSVARTGLNIREYFPLGPTRGPSRKGQTVKPFGWNSHPIEIQAANKFCDLFRLPIPVKSLRPMMIPGLISVAIVYLDACVFQGLDSPLFRERLKTLVLILRIHGEIWPLSKQASEDIQAVAAEYLTTNDSTSCRSSSSGSEPWHIRVDDAISSAPFLGSCVDPGFGTVPDPHLVQGWLTTGDWPDVLDTHQY
ncbi:hypothetical protein GGS20DRAFT_588123 [Poronia punctata]|nr:hypothetical protein GGS20DRAFT_588123 [Poronia punctata]